MTPKALIASIERTALKPFFTTDPTPSYLGTIHTSLTCAVCMEVLQRPIQLPCNELVCATCCTKSIAASRTTKCPCCYRDHLAEGTVKNPPYVVMDLLAGLLLKCKHCEHSVDAGIYQQHLDMNCSISVVHIPDSPSKHSIREVLDAPLDAPATPMEIKAAGQVLQRMLQHKESGNIIRVPTKGKVCTCKHKHVHLHMHSYNASCSHSA